MDSGDTWGTAILIADLFFVAVQDPNTQAPIRTGDGLAQPAVDPVTGDLYVVWQDSRFNGGQFAEIAIASSRDGGLTWSQPRRVNKSTGRPAFTPTVRVNGDGVVGVSFYDFRKLTPISCSLPTDLWLATSADGGVTFANEVHVAGSFDMFMAPFASGFFLGDYSGLVAVDNSFELVFVKTTTDPCNRIDDHRRPEHPVIRVANN